MKFLAKYFNATRIRLKIQRWIFGGQATLESKADRVHFFLVQVQLFQSVTFGHPNLRLYQVDSKIYLN